jgi:hypothetical protein
MSMDGRYFAKSQEGGAIYEPVVAHGCAVNEPKDGEDGVPQQINALGFIKNHPNLRSVDFGWL